MSFGWMQTVRFRIATTYAAVFVALGVLLTLAIVFGSRTSTSVAAKATPLGGVQVFPNSIVQLQHNADNERILVISLMVLVVTAAVAIPLGWFASGRMLRPLRQMTARARTISAGNLHQRLALAGPADEFKELGDTLDELLARLEASFEAQRRFVANASHELRTPLAVERTLLQVALADPNATAATLRATCEELLAAGREQERLLEALLSLASSERGLDHLEQVELADVTTRALRAVGPQAEQLGLSVTSTLSPATVSGDPALLERLVGNLVENAVHHNREGGSITVGTASEAGGVVLTVGNTGPVVAAGEVERLFEPFQRGAGRIGTESGHHGVGLSIVRAVALTHGAVVKAVPNPGGGLTVTVSFPAA